MRDTTPARSALWARVNQSHLTEARLTDLTGFKSQVVNFKIALWNPRTDGVRYLKTLIYNLCASLADKNWERLRHIKNRRLGNPITITYHGEQVCLDYLQAIFELEFIENNVSVRGRSILEIGAGYGRTCHAIVSNIEVASYYIVDLKNCLTLSRQYLEQVLDGKLLSKVRFILIDDIATIKAKRFDVCINIDSFAEMDKEAVRYYLDYIDTHCGYLYVKNPVGKYLDPSLSIARNAQEVKLALRAGILRQVIDINDDQAVARQVPKFKKAYRPGGNWKCIADSWAPPWSYYWQALYRKAKPAKTPGK